MATPAKGHRPGHDLAPRRTARRIPSWRAAGGHRRRALDVPRRDDRGPRRPRTGTAPGAVLLEPARPPVTTAAPGGDDQARALAQWQGPGAAPRTGEVFATLGSPAGSAVTVWLDASGKLTRPPLQPSQGHGSDHRGHRTRAVLALSLLTALRLAQRLADRRRLAAWDVAWSRVGPQWTRRRP